jgi:hypothetical protein
MSWPLASHFSAMLQNPPVAFRDPQLQCCAIEKNERGQPRPWAGAFAVVYKGIDPTKGPFAVRVFTTESPERRERYDLISAYLKGRKLNCLVDFEYRDRSIRSAGDGKWYPVILMDWVQGETLFKWVRGCCLAGSVDALARIADGWVEAVRELSDAQIAHGDLQHGNVMVTPAGEIRLVDYDGMCVPALVGRRNLEIGVEPYQHPDRNATTLLSLDIDNFSALQIYVALRALSVNPSLWLRYVEQQGYDKLLFRREDFQTPERSPLYGDLLGLGTDVHDLTEQLFAFARSRMEEVPPLSQLVGSYAKVERLLRARQWYAAVELLNRRGHFRDAPEPLRPLIREAYEHVCRQKAWEDFVKIPSEATEPVDRQLVEAWNEALFASFPPAEQERMRVAEARRRVSLMDRLRHFVQRTGAQISLSGEKSLVSAAAQLPQGYRHSLERRVELARRRVVAFARLERVLADPESEAAIVAAWRAVGQANCEQFVSIEWGIRIALAEERLPVLRALAKLPRNLPSDDRDRRVLAIWREDLLKDCREAEKWRTVHQRAAARKKILDQLRAAIETDDEPRLAKLAEQRWLEKYTLPDGWMGKLERARERTGRLKALLAALREGSEAATASAAPVSAASLQSCATTQEPGEASAANEPDETVAASGLVEPGTTIEASSAPAVPESQGVPPTEAPAGSESATLAGNASETAAPSSPSPPSSSPPFPAAPPAFRQSFDTKLLRDYPDRFAPYQALLAEWLPAEVLPLEKLGLQLTADQGGLTPADEPEGGFRAQWNWPEERFIDRCILAICPAEPEPAVAPEIVAAHWRESVSRRDWESGGGARLIAAEREWEGSPVVVWAVIDAGFQTFHSPPLVLGRIEHRSRWGWKRLFSRRSDAAGSTPTNATEP